MARVDPLRVFTSVPQAYAPFIKVGGKTFITLQEIPGQKFVASIARTAEAIDTNTRTLLTEVDVPNPDSRLLPGSFGEVHFKVGNNVDKVTVPVNAMLFRSQGAQVAVIGPKNKIELRQINIGRDFGTTLEILGGVAATDQVVRQSPGFSGRRTTGERGSICAAGPTARQRYPGKQRAAGTEQSAEGKWTVMRAGLLFVIAVLTLAAGCTVGPRYSRAPAPTPAPDAWKTQPPWQQAAPKDQFLKARGGRCITIPRSMGTKNNCSRQINRFWPQPTVWIRRARWRGLRPRTFSRNWQLIRTRLRERGSGNRPLNGEAPVINGVTQTVPPYTENVFTIPFSLN